MNKSREFSRLSRRPKRVLQIAVCMVLLSVLTTTAISVYSLNSVIQSHARSLTHLLANGIQDAILSEIMKVSMVARTISNDTLLNNILRIESTYPQDYIADRIDSYLKGVKKGIQFDTAFIVSSSSRMIYGDGAKVRPLNPQDPRDNWFNIFIDQGRPRATRVQADTFNQSQCTFFIFSRMVDEESRMLGMCGVGFPLVRLQNILKEFEKTYALEICLIDWDGICQVASEKRLTGSTVSGLPEHFRRNREYDFKEEENGSYVLTRYLSEIGWFLVIKGARAEGREAFSELILANVVAIVLIFTLLFLVTQHFVGKERKLLEKHALTDNLTSILNRSGFEQAFSTFEEHGANDGTLFILDLDHFKAVNDHLGHPEGDRLLQRTAQVLTSHFRDDDIVARLGGDEFIVFAGGLTDQSSIKDKAERLMESIRKSYSFPDGQNCTVSVSIGAAICPWHGDRYKTLYTHADAALYASKNGGRNRFTLYGQS